VVDDYDLFFVDDKGIFTTTLWVDFIKVVIRPARPKGLLSVPSLNRLFRLFCFATVSYLQIEFLSFPNDLLGKS
jgi:hypothetical protein